MLIVRPVEFPRQELESGLQDLPGLAARPRKTPWAWLSGRAAGADVSGPAGATGALDPGPRDQAWHVVRKWGDMIRIPIPYGVMVNEILTAGGVRKDHGGRLRKNRVKRVC